jgi:hypothetical protein
VLQEEFDVRCPLQQKPGVADSQDSGLDPAVWPVEERNDWTFTPTRFDVFRLVETQRG